MTRVRNLTMLTIIAFAGRGVPEPPDRIWVTVPEDAAIAAVAESLQTRGVIGSGAALIAYMRMVRKTDSIKPGMYHLLPRMPIAKAAQALVAGVAPIDSITIAERATLAEIAVVFGNSLGRSVDSFQTAVRDPRLLARVGARGETLEGYLFPTRYYVRTTASVSEILEQMIDEFEAQWSREWNARLDSLDLTRDELVTLASIISGEMAHAEDRGLVSSVYHNRLDRNMRLQADPTVVYALGERRRLRNRDYQIASPYNTYKINGLPPHPIGQPSHEAIVAALYPDSSDYLYFVAAGEGRHLFSQSYREHLATIRAVRTRPISRR